MIKINSFWVNEVKNIINGLNEGIKQKNSEVVKGYLLELMKLLNEKYNYELRSSAAMAFVEISELYPKLLKKAIPIIIDLLNDDDSFMISYAINTLDNLFNEFPEEIKLSIKNMKKSLNTYDPSVRKIALSLIKKIALKFPSYLKNYEEILSELKLTSHDLDRNISSLANEIIKLIEEKNL